MGILLKDITAVLPVGDSMKTEKTTIYIEGDAIAGIGTKPEGFVENKVIEGKDKLVIPGLINAHTHSYMALFRNVADDVPFMDWLFKGVDPLEQQMVPEDAYWGASLAIMEMLRCGTTCFNDMQMHIGQTTRAAAEAGMRAVISRGLVGSGNDEAGSSRLKEAYAEMEQFKDVDTLRFFLGPHAPYTCDEAYLRIVAEEAKAHGLGIHIHLAESQSEIDGVRENYGCTPFELAERAGLFEVPAIAAHCVRATKSDMKIMKEKHVSAVTNPASNMKLGNGFAPVPALLEMGINVCLGTDGAASNNSLNMFHELSLLTLIHKGVKDTPECISAKEGLQIATINGARALCLADKVGTIEVGKKADLAILDLNTPSMMPRNNLIAGLSYSANGSEVETVIINGKVVMENKVLMTMDEERIYFEVDRICRRMGLDKKTY